MESIVLKIQKSKPYAFYKGKKYYKQKRILDLIRSGVKVVLFDENGFDITTDSVRKMRLKHQKDIMRFSINGKKCQVYDYTASQSSTQKRIIECIFSGKTVEVIKDGRDVTHLFLAKAFGAFGGILSKERLIDLIAEMIDSDKNRKENNIMKMLKNFKVLKY